MEDAFRVTGKIHLLLTDEQGRVKDERKINNMVVNLGLAYIASRMMGTAQAVMTHMAVGTGVTAETQTQTALTTEVSRVALTSSTIINTNVTGDSVQYVCVYLANVGISGALSEAGIFNAASAGIMLARKTFAVVNKANADTLTATWVITAA